MKLQKQMNQAMGYIEEQLTDVIDFQQLARYINSTEWEFRRLFSVLTGIPLSEYIRKRKLSCAVLDLKNSMKVVDVAVKYGYASQAAFSRAFKLFHGMAPSKIKNEKLTSFSPITFKLVLMEEISMEGKERVIVGGSGDRYGITIDLDHKEIHQTNESFWNETGNRVIGCLALPLYGAFISEEKVQLLGDLKNKKILDVGCGTGESLKYVASKNPAELWGLDISKDQLNKTQELLANHHLTAQLICSPMEDSCGIPDAYFDLIYSVYGIGWTTNLEETFMRIASYLKKDGIFIFSWSHPIHKCVSVEYDTLTFKKSYFDEEWYNVMLKGGSISLADRKLSTYINTLIKAGFMIEQLIEESQEELLLASKSRFSEKAQMLPVTFVIKARKL